MIRESGEIFTMNEIDDSDTNDSAEYKQSRQPNQNISLFFNVTKVKEKKVRNELVRSNHDYNHQLTTRNNIDTTNIGIMLP